MDVSHWLPQNSAAFNRPHALLHPCFWYVTFVQSNRTRRTSGTRASEMRVYNWSAGCISEQSDTNIVHHFTLGAPRYSSSIYSYTPVFQASHCEQAPPINHDFQQLLFDQRERSQDKTRTTASRPQREKRKAQQGSLEERAYLDGDSDARERGPYQISWESNGGACSGAWVWPTELESSETEALSATWWQRTACMVRHSFLNWTSCSFSRSTGLAFFFWRIE